MTETPSPGQLAQIACLLEVTARKPGNVHRGCDFADAHYLDFLLSTTALVGPLDRARERGVGAAALEAIVATRRVVSTNTNLGMVLLLAPLAAVPAGEPLAEGVLPILDSTTLDDARLVYLAIRLVSPGGLGTVAAQDVASEPTVTLTQAMALAADHDLIARQYVNGFADVFRSALPALRAALKAGRPLETAIVFAHLSVLACHADTLIARKHGAAEAAEATRRAFAVLAAGWPDDPAAGLALGRDLDAWLRAEGNARSPGATADLIAAALYAALRDGTIPLPMPHGRWSMAEG